MYFLIFVVFDKQSWIFKNITLVFLRNERAEAHISEH